MRRKEGRPMDPRVIRPKDTPTFQLGNIAAQVVLSGGACAGALTIVEAPISPRSLAGPLHTHHNEDALWYVLEGDFGAQVGEEVFHEGAGALVLAPRGIPHTYWNPSDSPAKYLEMAWPAGLEHFLAGLAHVVEDGGEDVFGEVERISKAFGIEMDWESLPLLMERHGVGFDLASEPDRT